MPTGHRQPRVSLHATTTSLLVSPAPLPPFLSSRKKSSCRLNFQALLSFFQQHHFCQKSSSSSSHLSTTTGRTKHECREAAPGTGPPRASAVAPRRGERPQQSPSSSLVSQSFGRRCADTERPWGGSRAVRHVGEHDGVVAAPDDPGAPLERRVGGGCLGGRSGDSSHLPPSAADFSVSSFIFST